MIRFLKIQALRVRLGLLRLERAMRLDAMLTMYAEKPAQLTPETVREVLRDVDDDIVQAEGRIAELRQPSQRQGAAWYLCLLLAVAVLVVVAISENLGAPVGRGAVHTVVWRQA